MGFPWENGKREFPLPINTSSLRVGSRVALSYIHQIIIIIIIITWRWRTDNVRFAALLALNIALCAILYFIIPPSRLCFCLCLFVGWLVGLWAELFKMSSIKLHEILGKVRPWDKKHWIGFCGWSRNFSLTLVFSSMLQRKSRMHCSRESHKTTGNPNTENCWLALAEVCTLWMLTSCSYFTHNTHMFYTHTFKQITKHIIRTMIYIVPIRLFYLLTYLVSLLKSYTGTLNRRQKTTANFINKRETINRQRYKSEVSRVPGQRLCIWNATSPKIVAKSRTRIT